MSIDLLAENPNPFFDPMRISRAINDPRKNFLKTIWQKGKPVLDSELNEREDIDNFIRREISVLLGGELAITEGLFPIQSASPDTVCFSAGQMLVRGYELIVEKNGGGFPSVDQNFNILVVDPLGGPPQVFPTNGLGFSPNINIDQPVGDSHTTVIAAGTFYSVLDRQLCVELENTCSVGAVTYMVQTLDGVYSQTITIHPQQRATVCLKENLVNCVQLPARPGASMGNHIDFVYLYFGEVEICATVSEVKRNGHLSHPESVPTNIFDPNVGYETTRRTQLQFDIRSCSGQLPIPPSGFYVYPLYCVVRQAGVAMVKLQDITTLVTQIDLEKTGLFDLINQGAGLSYKSILNVFDDGSVVPPTLESLPVGSTINVVNCGTSARSLTFFDGTQGTTPALNNCAVDGSGFETLVLNPNESAAVNFPKVGDFILQDERGAILTVVSIVKWGGGTGGDTEFINIAKCAIGLDYFKETGPLHPCDDSINPLPDTEQSLDYRTNSVVFDMFEMALCCAKAQSSSTTQLSYLFVDTFTDLNAIDNSVAVDNGLTSRQIVATVWTGSTDNSIPL